MKPSLFAIASATLFAFGSHVAAAPAAKPPLQRLVGTVTIAEDFAMLRPDGKPFMTRTMTVTGKFNQLVRVLELHDGALQLDVEGGGPILLSGAVEENGKLAQDTPNGNLVVKARGNSSWNGKLGKVNLDIARSKLGAGDEIVLTFATPVAGKMEMLLTDSAGMTTDHGSAGQDLFLSLMEEDADDPARRTYKRDYRFLPSLGGVPSDAFSKMMYDGLKKHPEIAHIGLSTTPDRRTWRYAGSTSMGDKVGKRSKETVTLELMLVKP